MEINDVHCKASAISKDLAVNSNITIPAQIYLGLLDMFSCQAYNLQC